MADAQPLSNRLPIVNEDGTPTEFFMRWAKQFNDSALGPDSLTEIESDITDIENDIAALDLDSLTDVDTVTTPPTNNQVLGWDNGSSLWVPKTVSGGGGGGFPVVRPSASQFTQATNHGGGTKSLVDYGDIIVACMSTSGTSHQGFFYGVPLASPGDPFEVTARVKVYEDNDNWICQGLAVQSDSNTSISIIGSGPWTNNDTLTQLLSMSNMSNNTTASGTTVTGAYPLWMTNFLYCKIGFDGTDIIGYLSLDGLAWLELARIPAENVFGVGKVPLYAGLGAYATATGSGSPLRIICDHFEIT